jgi:hypothetical protein
VNGFPLSNKAFSVGGVRADFSGATLGLDLSGLCPPPKHLTASLPVVLDYESARWDQLAPSATRVGLREEFLPDLYLQSVRWVAEVLADASALV